MPAALVRLVDRRHRLGSASGLLMMTGGYLGWQPLAVALAMATMLTLAMATRRRITGNTFAMILAGSLVFAWLGWRWLGPLVRGGLFDAVLLGVCTGILTVGLIFVAKLSD